MILSTTSAALVTSHVRLAVSARKSTGSASRARSPAASLAAMARANRTSESPLAAGCVTAPPCPAHPANPPARCRASAEPRGFSASAARADRAPPAQYSTTGAAGSNSSRWYGLAGQGGLGGGYSPGEIRDAARRRGDAPGGGDLLAGGEPAAQPGDRRPAARLG